ncbi:MAG: PQQ-dependent sugar dehydrogenase, partial [Planctomycetota bacterium]
MAQPMDLSDSTVAPGTTITDIQVLSNNHTVRLTPYAQNPGGVNMGFVTDMQVDALGRTLLTSLDGRIHLIDTTGNIQSTPWITTDSADGFAPTNSRNYDYGLTSIALHPDFHNMGSAGYGKFYTVEANNTEPAGGYDSDFDHPFTGYHENGGLFTDGEHESVLVEYTTTAPAASSLTRGTDTSRRVLATFHQGSHSHNIGDLVFGPDNLLYVTSGDGGNATDYENNSNFTDNAYGKILRIDPLTLTNTSDRSVFSVDGEARFSVPTDNPHYDGGTIGAEDMVF